MTTEPKKRFPRVSNCCQADFFVSCGDEGTCCHICTNCDKACDPVANEELEKLMTQNNFMFNNPKISEKTIGDRIKRFRNMANISQEELAKKSGVSRTYIIQLETNRSRHPSAEKLWDIATALNISVEGLITDNVHASGPCDCEGGLNNCKFRNGKEWRKS